MGGQENYIGKWLAIDKLLGNLSLLLLDEIFTLTDKSVHG